MARIERTHHELGHHDGQPTLVQRFRFASTTAAALAHALMTAPLVGDASIFGARPGEEIRESTSVRRMTGFSPVPGFRFDVELTAQGDGVFLVRFSQPDRGTPYLQGDAVWTFIDAGDGAVFEERINTREAMAVAEEPLGGPRPSLRRWLFFRAGHKQVMTVATTNLAALA